MKKLFAIALIILALPLAVFAESYSSLWKQVEKAQQEDHPQTVWKLLLQISDKAEQEKEYGQLLKAQLMYIQAVTAVSPDSLRPELQRFESKVQQAEKGSDKALAAVYDCVLGKMYASSDYYNSRDAAYNDADSDADTMTPEERQKTFDKLSKEYMEKAMRNMDVLAKTKSSGYEPIVVPGNDDYRYFNSDLLHVIGFETGNYKKISDYYLKKGNRAAACLAAFYQTQKERYDDVKDVRKSKYLATIDSLCHAYEDIPESGIFAVEHFNFMEGATDATAEEKIEYIDYALRTWPTWVEINKLKNARKLITLPSFHAYIEDCNRTSKQTTLLDITSATHINSLTLNVVKMNMTGDHEFNPNNEKDYAMMKNWREKTPAFTKTLTYIGQPDYKALRDTIIIPELPLGVYLVELLTDNGNIRPERSLLYVSDLRLVKLPLPGNNQRWAVLDANSGKPVHGATVRFKNRAGKRDEQSFVTDSQGEVNFQYDSNKTVYTIVSTDTDKASQWKYTNVSLYGDDFEYDEDDNDDCSEIFSDRAIYRPGQKVMLTGVLFQKNETTNETKALAGRKGSFVLYSPNYKKLETKEVVFDEWGYANTEFILPQDGLTGQFSVQLNFDDNNGKEKYGSRTYLRVEQYKRPTFEVKFDAYKEAYQQGDTITVKGQALSYAGVPVQGAKVVVSAASKQSYLWRYNSTSGASINLDTLAVVTDDNGRFEKRIPMILPEKSRNDFAPRYMNIIVSAIVTDQAGESHSAELRLPLSDKPTILTTSLPEKFIRDSLSTIKFNYMNNAGKPIEGKVTYSIDGGNQQTVTANESIDFSASALASGRHTLYAYNETDSLKHDFIVFTLDDKRPAVDTLMWSYQTARQFADDATPVRLQLGTSAKDQYVIYAIVSSTGNVLENGEMTLNDENINRDFFYKKEWGDGIALRYAWVRDGHIYTYNSNIVRPIPNKNLTLEWKTFRNKLVPGQKEEWTLTVKNPDGTPAKAHVIATMYDKSLDDITYSPFRWSNINAVSNGSGLYFSAYGENEKSQISLYGEDKYTPINVKDLSFAHIELPMYQRIYFTKTVKRAPLMMMATGSAELSMDMAYEEAAPAPMAARTAPQSAKAKNGAAMEADVVEEVVASGAAKASESQTPQVRENLNETAFFMPNLVTDKDGNVSMKFTLPESVTTWRVLGMASDKTMNNGSISDEVVAQKTVMVQPNQPRFLREGDNAIIAARISNTSDTQQMGTTYIDFLDPETEQSVYLTQQKFSVDAQKTIGVNFSVPGNLTTGLYIMKVVAQGKGFSDGEQHYVAVLPDKELVTTTRAFTQTKPGTKTIDLKGLFGKNSTGEKLTVEYTNNPSWLMVQALPVMSDPCSKDAVSLTSALYANSIGRFILQQNPDLKQTMDRWLDDDTENSPMLSALNKNEELKTMVLNETPWVRASDREEKVKQQIMEFFNDSISDSRQTIISTQLKKLQNPNGSFSWWPGMPASPSVSMTVAKMLARLNKMIRTNDGSLDICNNAMRYLDNVINDEVIEMKNLEKKGAKKLLPSELAIDYLYTQAILGRKITSRSRENAQYLLSRIKGHASDLTIYGKAHMAVVFAITPAGPDEEEAQSLLESVRQYTVATEEMGRYFDTKNAYYSWCDYRIPSEVAAIEALQILDPENKDMVSQMQQWLLQEKRTQMWNTTINSTDAVYAFLNGRTSETLTAPVQQTRLAVDGKTLATNAPTAGLGYVKTQIDGRHTTFTAEKTSSNISWGAVYAQSFQPVSEIEKDGEAISVKREVLVADGKGGWSHLKGNLNVGDKVKVRITIKTSRDLDFVQVSDKRAACLEPINQLSGYRNGYYCAPQDNQTNYYFYQLRKGTQQLETEYYVDRAGTYTTGTCTAQCAYVPEYIGRTPAVKIVVN